MGVSKHDGIDRARPRAKGLRHLKIWHLTFRTGFVATIDENTRFGGLKQERRTADLPTAAERRDAHPLFTADLLAVDLSTDAFEHVASLLAFVFEEAPDV
jgi:hypothetical protein